MAVELSAEQLKAINNLKNGSILCGGVGSGKSRTALGYYLFKVCKGDIGVIDDQFGEVLPFYHSRFEPMETPRDLYIITTARKRDSHEWEEECGNFCLYPDQDILANAYGVQVVIDSWNNIKKYQKVTNAFFIFDEQRVVGSGAWVRAFLDITRKNEWILLSATPGDQWKDYIPVFVANGFYRNKTEFNSMHCMFSRYSKYPRIERYINEKLLIKYRDKILVLLKDRRTTVRDVIPVKVGYDKTLFRKVYVDHWNPYENEPIEESGKWCYLLRKVVNSDPSRILEVDKILKEKKYVIIFYNFKYELDLLRSYLDSINYVYKEWNGQKHEDVPKCKDGWVYLVQYSAGCEAWNCITTDTIIFYSQNYSYRIVEQASGRIDRINTPFHTLYYYHLRSNSPIDLAIHQALRQKRKFNESSFVWR